MDKKELRSATGRGAIPGSVHKINIAVQGGGDYAVLMTEEQRNLIRHLWWLCGELRAGNSFSDEQLLKWELEAQVELARTRPPTTFEEPAQARQDAWDRAYGQTMAFLKQQLRDSDQGFAHEPPLLQPH